MRARVLAAGWVAVTFVASAFAQETWMMPSSFSANVGDEVRFDLSGGTAFPRLQNAVQAERVATAGFRLGQDRVALKNPKTTGTSLAFRQVFSKDGVATLRLALKPKDIELTDGDVAAYLDEIGASADIRSTWAGRKGRVPWKETYTKHAKTFVAVGRAALDRSWATGGGTALELVPTTNPFTIQAGHEFTVELQANSKPVSNLRVGLLMDGSSDRVFRMTDAAGRATFPIAKAGRAMLFAVDLRTASDGRSWLSDYCTLTLEAHGAKPLAAIGDSEWTLAEIDGHPLAPGTKAPIFMLTGGKAGGFGGCNRYTGPVTENGPGLISFGELASTRMACPDAQMSLEAGFLNNLRHVTTYAFQDGRLAFSWQDGRESGVLSVSAIDKSGAAPPRASCYVPIFQRRSDGHSNESPRTEAQRSLHETDDPQRSARGGHRPQAGPAD